MVIRRMKYIWSRAMSEIPFSVLEMWANSLIMPILHGILSITVAERCGLWRLYYLTNTLKSR